MPLPRGVRGARSPLPYRSSLNMQKDIWKSKKDDQGPSFLISVL